MVVINKLDLCADSATRVAAIEEVALGVPVHAISALRGELRLLDFCRIVLGVQFSPFLMPALNIESNHGITRVPTLLETAARDSA